MGVIEGVVAHETGATRPGEKSQASGPPHRDGHGAERAGSRLG
jgi:hypothetical protein